MTPTQKLKLTATVFGLMVLPVAGAQDKPSDKLAAGVYPLNAQGNGKR